jgi:hypothetical protein
MEIDPETIAVPRDIKEIIRAKPNNKNANLCFLILLKISFIRILILLL